MKSFWRRLLIGELTWRRMLVSALLIYAFLVVLGLFFSERLIFPYHGSSYTRDVPGLRFLFSADGTPLAVRYWPSSNEQFLALYFHGNYEDIGQLGPIADRLNTAGFSVLAMDYRGYGRSQGRVSEGNTYADAEALYDEALKMGYDANRIVLWGRSVGSGPAVELGTRRETRAVVLESPFMSAFRVVSRIPILPFDKFNNLRKMKELTTPLFIIHGNSDTVIPARHSKRLYDRHAGPKRRVVIAGAGHNDLWSYPLDSEFAALADFLNGTAMQKPAVEEQEETR